MRQPGLGARLGDEQKDLCVHSAGIQWKAQLREAMPTGLLRSRGTRAKHLSRNMISMYLAQ